MGTGKQPPCPCGAVLLGVTYQGRLQLRELLVSAGLLLLALQYFAIPGTYNVDDPNEKGVVSSLPSLSWSSTSRTTQQQHRLRPCRVAVTNRRPYHYEILESIASQFPLKYMTMLPPPAASTLSSSTTNQEERLSQQHHHPTTAATCDSQILHFDYFAVDHETRVGLPVRDPSAQQPDQDYLPQRFLDRFRSYHLGYFNEEMRHRRARPDPFWNLNNNNDDEKHKQQRWIGNFFPLDSEKLDPHEQSETYDVVIEASCFCEQDSIYWLLGDDKRICIFHFACEPLAYHPRAVWISPHHKHRQFFLPTLLPELDDRSSSTTNAIGKEKVPFLDPANFSNQLGINVPMLRFKGWNELSDNAKQAAVSLGYHEETWNIIGSNVPLETISYQLILEMAEKTNRDALLTLGFTKPQQWDCYIQHYSDYTWDELDSKVNVQHHYVVLGWDRLMWNSNNRVIPEVEHKSWNDLTVEEQNAAHELCYFPQVWDDIPIPMWNRIYGKIYSSQRQHKQKAHSFGNYTTTTTGRNRQLRSSSSSTTATTPHKLCVVGDFERRASHLLEAYLDFPKGQKSQESRRFWLELIGGAHEPQAFLRRRSDVAMHVAPKGYVDFYRRVVTCDGILALVSSDAEVESRHYFNSTPDSHRMLSGTMSIIIQYKIPYVIHHEMYELYRDYLPPNVPHRLHGNDPEGFIDAMTAFLDDLDMTPN